MAVEIPNLQENTMQVKTIVLLMLAGFAIAAQAADNNTNSGNFRRGVSQNSTTQTEVFDDKPQPVPDEKKTPPAPPQEGGRKTPPNPR